MLSNVVAFAATKRVGVQWRLQDEKGSDAGDDEEAAASLRTGGRQTEVEQQHRSGFLIAVLRNDAFALSLSAIKWCGFVRPCSQRKPICRSNQLHQSRGHHRGGGGGGGGGHGGWTFLSLLHPRATTILYYYYDRLQMAWWRAGCRSMCHYLIWAATKYIVIPLIPNEFWPSHKYIICFGGHRSLK
jgi:hypothetical protein